MPRERERGRTLNIRQKAATICSQTKGRQLEAGGDGGGGGDGDGGVSGFKDDDGGRGFLLDSFYRRLIIINP